MVAELVAAAAVVAGTWQNEPSLPLPRTEVAGAVVRGEVYVVGGYGRLLAGDTALAPCP